MKIKKYRVNKMQEGLTQIRKEMGPEAVIIESRKIRQAGLRGYFLPRVLEITAAVDTEPAKIEQGSKEIPISKHINDELIEMKNMMQALLFQQSNSKLQSNKMFDYWLTRLTENDVDQNYAVDILSSIQQYLQGKELNVETMESFILNMLKALIKTCELNPKTKYISFVGPTGVGKSTTLAKLAANAHFKQGKKVAVITIDTYRIGAVEQLKVYAELTGIPLEVVYSLKEMYKAVEKYNDYDVVFIDTAGRSAKNSLHIAETAQYVQCLNGDSVVFLVISATTKVRDLHRIAQAYKSSNYSSVIITKIDETETYGTILNVARLTSMPVAYITVGQNVPEDIEPANADRLAEMVLGEDRLWLTKQNG